jgi:2-O-methyltransferase
MNIQDYINQESLQVNLLSLFFKDNLPKVFLEIGACEGEDSIKYLRNFPSVFLYAIEALPENTIAIHNNLSDAYKGRFQLIEAAVTEFDGTYDLYVSSGHPEGIPKTKDWNYGNKSSSILAPTKLMNNIHKWLNFNKKIKVNGVSLETIISKLPYEFIDFVHLDVQGAELGILKGGRKILRNIRCLWVEVSEKEIYHQQAMAADIEKFMKENGFVKVLDTLSNGFGDHFYLNTNRFTFNIK